MNQLQTSKAVADMELGMVRERIIDVLSWMGEQTGACWLPPIIVSSELSPTSCLHRQELNDSNQDKQQPQTGCPAKDNPAMSVPPRIFLER